MPQKEFCSLSNIYLYSSLSILYLYFYSYFYFLFLCLLVLSLLQPLCTALLGIITTGVIRHHFSLTLILSSLPFYVHSGNLSDKDTLVISHKDSCAEFVEIFHNGKVMPNTTEANPYSENCGRSAESTTQRMETLKEVVTSTTTTSNRSTTTTALIETTTTWQFPPQKQKWLPTEKHRNEFLSLTAVRHPRNRKSSQYTSTEKQQTDDAFMNFGRTFENSTGRIHKSSDSSHQQHSLHRHTKSSQNRRCSRQRKVSSQPNELLTFWKAFKEMRSIVREASEFRHELEWLKYGESKAKEGRILPHVQDLKALENQKSADVFFEKESSQQQIQRRQISNKENERLNSLSDELPSLPTIPDSLKQTSKASVPQPTKSTREEDSKGHWVSLPNGYKTMFDYQLRNPLITDQLSLQNDAGGGGAFLIPIKPADILSLLNEYAKTESLIISDLEKSLQKSKSMPKVEEPTFYNYKCDCNQSDTTQTRERIGALDNSRTKPAAISK